MLSRFTNQFVKGALLGLALGFSLGAQQVQAVAAGGTLTVQLQPYQGSIIRNSVPVLPGVSSVNIGREAIATSSVGVLTTLRCEANGPPSTGHGGWSSAGGKLAVSYSANAPVAGILRMTMQPACFMNPAYFDIDADGIYELIGLGATIDVPVVLAKHPRLVEFSNEVVNFAPGVCSGNSSIEFLPAPRELDVIGTACGPELTAVLLPRTAGKPELDLHASSVTQGLGVFVFGTRPSSWPLPCPLFTEIDVAVSAPASQGHAGFKLHLPSHLRGVFLVQYIGVGQNPLTISSSNAIRLALP